MPDSLHISKVVLIGGSAGSMPVVEFLLKNLPEKFMAAIIIILHRPKNTNSDMDTLFSHLSGVRVTEPEDKAMLFPGSVLLAPQNYHLLAEPDGTVSLDYSEPEKYSRPSINISFESFSDVYRSTTTAILLSGLNNDGASGIASVITNGGKAYIQEPSESEFSFMPEAAKAINPGVPYYNRQQLSILLNSIVT